MRRRACLALVSAGLIAPSVLAATNEPLVTLHTSLGDIVVALALHQAPASAGAFLGTVKAGSYDGGAFTRVVRPDNDHGRPVISVVQGVARRGAAIPPAVRHESTRETGLRHRDGTVSLTRDAVGTANGAEFFICIGDQPGLDHGGMRIRDGQGFAAFGHVVLGMDVVRSIWSSDASGPSTDTYTNGQMLKAPVAILRAAAT